MQINHKTYSPKQVRQFISQADLPAIISTLDHADKEFQARIFKYIPSDRAEEIFSYLEPTTQARILQDLDTKKAIAVLETMEPDDRVKLFQELPDPIATHFLKRLSSKERRATTLLMKYPEETAGRIMSPFFITLDPKMTVEASLEKIRKEAKDAETIYVLPVVDQDSQQLQGIVDLDCLVMEKPQALISSVMAKEFRSFSVRDDQETVARFIQSTDRLAVPVVDDHQKLCGIITIDDAMDVMQMEETEDIIRGGASAPLGKPYLTVSVFRLMQTRVVWLILLAFAGVLTVNVLNAFEATLEQGIVLALFIPLLIGIGGNTGSQSATTIVRAMAMDHIRNNDFIKVALRETAVGILMGCILGIIGYGVIAVLFQQKIAAIVAFSTVAICTVAALAGSLMPMLAKVLRLDPAVVSTPLVSTVIDATGLLIYFMIARAILNF